MVHKINKKKINKIHINISKNEITAGEAGAFSSLTASLFFLVFFLDDAEVTSGSIGASSILITGSLDGSFSLNKWKNVKFF